MLLHGSLRIHAPHTQKSHLSAAHRKPPLGLDFGSPARTRTADLVINSHPLTGTDKLTTAERQSRMRRSASANASERAGHASIQISASGSAIPGCPRGRLQSIQPGPTFDFGQALPIVSTAHLCVLGMCYRGVTRNFPEIHAGSIVDLSVPQYG